MTSKRSGKKSRANRQSQRQRRKPGNRDKVIENLGWGLEGSSWQNNGGGAFNCVGFLIPIGGTDVSSGNQVWTLEQWCDKVALSNPLLLAANGVRVKVSLIGTYTQAMQAPSGSPTILPQPLTPYVSLWQVIASGGQSTGTSPANMVFYGQVGGDQDDSYCAEILAQGICGSVYPLKGIEKIKYCSVRPIDWYGGTLPAISGSANAEIVSYRIQGGIRVPAKWHKGFHANYIVEAEYSDMIMLMVRWAIPAAAGYYGPNWMASGRTRMMVRFESQAKTISDILA